MTVQGAIAERATSLMVSFGQIPFGLRVLLVVFSAAWLALFVHEVAHALVARLLGVRVWSISLGSGPTLWDGEVSGCGIHIGLFPFHGAIRLHDGDAEGLGYENLDQGETRFAWRSGSWRAPLISAAGTFANLVAAKAVMAYWLSGPRPHPSVLLWTLAVFLVNAFMLLNLAPFRGFDGWRIALHTAAWRGASIGARRAP